MTEADDGPPLDRIPSGVWALGFVSMLADVSSELVHSLLPLFMVSVLGTSTLVVGLIEGAGEATALIVKVFSGTLSDYLGKRKLLAVIGYGLGALTKPLFALATGAGTVLAARLLDRTGKGIRGAPRDALVADITPPTLRGAAWGLHMGMTQGLLATMVAQTAPADLRGTAFGLFNLMSGLAMLVASALAGLLWERFGPSVTFFAGALFCALALVAIGLKFGHRSTP